MFYVCKKSDIHVTVPAGSPDATDLAAAEVEGFCDVLDGLPGLTISTSSSSESDEPYWASREEVLLKVDVGIPRCKSFPLPPPSKKSAGRLKRTMTTSLIIFQFYSIF